MKRLVPIQNRFYGDNYRWFFGTVINAHPPAGLEGRVKVRINGVHSPSTADIPEKDLPWAQVMLPSTEGGASGLGRVPQLQPGSFVFGVFLDGQASQIPLVLGSIPRIELPSSVQKGKRVQKGNEFSYAATRYQNVVTSALKDDDKQEASLQLRRQQSMKFFIDNGYDLIHAAALTGALQATSGFVTHYTGNDNLYTGIAMWEKTNTVGSRFKGLTRFAREYQPASNWKLYSIQLQFVLYELRNRFNQVNNKFLATTDFKTGMEVIFKEYLFLSIAGVESLAQTAYDEVLA